MVHGQNTIRTKCYADKMVLDKMVQTEWYGQNAMRTKWYRQNGTDKMLAIFGIDYNSSEFSTYLVIKSHK